MKKVSIALLASCLLLLQGCATTIPLNPSIKKSIHTVSVNESMTKPEQPYLMEPGIAVGMGFGAVGGLVTGVIEEKHGKLLENYFRTHNIDVRKIVRNEVIHSLLRKKTLKYVSKDGNADLRLKIKFYGFSVPHGFSSQLMPILQVEGQLIKNNVIVWQKTESTPFSTKKLPHYDATSLRQNPQLYAVMLKAAVQDVSKKLVASFG